MFRHILVTTDGSPLGNLALPTAADLARKYGATLTLLYVLPPPPTGVFAEGAAYAYDYEEERERLLEYGTHLLDEARRSTDYPDTQVLCLEGTGQPVAQVIADQAERRGVDLVVMSTHGRSGLANFFLGSVAGAVLRKVQMPVLLVRTPKTAAKAPPAEPQENAV